MDNVAESSLVIKLHLYKSRLRLFNINLFVNDEKQRVHRTRAL